MTTKKAFKELDEKQKNAYLAMQRQKALRAIINKSDYSITTIETKKITLTSGLYKGEYEVGENASDAKNKLFDSLLDKFVKENPLDNYIPENEAVEVNVDKINEYIADKGL